MADWFARLVAEWSVIAAAPVAFASAVLVVIAVSWAIVNWSYSSVLSNKNAQIELLQSRVADYQDKLKGASPDQAASEITRLKVEIESLKNPPRDDNSVYQKGRRIGIVSGVRVDLQNKVVTFDAVTVGGALDQATNIEFRDLILSFISSDAIMQARQGAAANITYHNARFSVVGNRN
jgi:hypothetical protein